FPVLCHRPTGAGCGPGRVVIGVQGGWGCRIHQQPGNDGGPCPVGSFDLDEVGPRLAGCLPGKQEPIRVMGNALCTIFLLEDAAMRWAIMVTGLVGFLLAAPGKAVRSDDAKAGFFNSKDLAGWEGLLDYWKVKDGALVGSTYPEGL